MVARIGDYTITRDELRERLLREMRPREDDALLEFVPVTAEGTLRDMVAEKAMILEGRKLGYTNEETIRSSVEQFEQQQLVRALVQGYLKEKMPATVDEAEVDRLRKSNPKLTPEQATSLAQKGIASRLVQQFYDRLVEKLQLKRVEANLPKTANIHKRLLDRPAQPRGKGQYWIKNSQVRDELSEQEKNLVLATYQGGQFVLKDWFRALCNIVPPRRPQDLNTPDGVRKLLDQALRTPILVAEARIRGLDNDADLKKRIRELEDQRVLWKAMEARTKSLEMPTDEQIKACFEENKDKFAQSAVLKVDQIWCRDRKTAEKARQSLEEGAEFETVKRECSLAKDRGPHDTSPSSEGPFWDDLWKADPNEIVGPVRGFYSDGVRWRIAKVLQKTPAKEQPFSEQIADRVKWALQGRRREQVIKEYRKELLGTYAHEILTDRIKDMDPLEIATKEGDE